MIDKNIYANLPNSLNSNQLERLITQLLAQYSIRSHKKDLMFAISEICQRVTRIDTVKNQQLLNELSDALISAWDNTDLENTEDFINGAIVLHLQKAYSYLMGQKDIIADDKVKNSLIETYEEIDQYFEYWK